MPTWQDVFQNRKDELITSINKDRRDIERLHDAINAINGNIHIQQVELDAVERALMAVPDGRLTAAEVTKRIAQHNLTGMTDESASKVDPTKDRHGNPVGTKYKPDSFA